MTYSVNQAITYTAVASTPGFPLDTFAYSWAFDDGGTGNTASLPHTWTTVGPHSATVTATDNTTLESASATKSITVIGSGPVTPDLNYARFAHRSVTLNDGRVLIVGGYSTGPLSVCEIYDPVSNTFTPTGSMITPRASFSITKLNSGNVLVCGGDIGSDWYIYPNDLHNSPSNLCEVYSATNGTWSSTANNMAVARSWHGSEILPSGKVIVHGGIVSNGVYTNTTDIYDPATNSFSPGPVIPTTMAWHGHVRLAGGDILIWGGGNGVKTYRLTEGGAWQTKADCITPQTPAIWAFGFCNYGDTVYQFAGAAGSPSFQNPSNILAIYDASANTWTSQGNIATQNGPYANGSCNSSGVLMSSGVNTPTKVDFYSGSITNLSDKPNGYAANSIYLNNGYVLITGGNNNPNAIKSANRYYIG